jgi:uncharacterized membrane protein
LLFSIFCFLFCLFPRSLLLLLLGKNRNTTKEKAFVMNGKFVFSEWEYFIAERIDSYEGGSKSELCKAQKRTCEEWMDEDLDLCTHTNSITEPYVVCQIVNGECHALEPVYDLPPQRGGVSGGTVAAIVLAVIFGLVAAALLVLVLIYVFKIRKKEDENDKDGKDKDQQKVEEQEEEPLSTKKEDEMDIDNEELEENTDNDHFEEEVGKYVDGDFGQEDKNDKQGEAEVSGVDEQQGEGETAGGDEQQGEATGGDEQQGEGETAGGDDQQGEATGGDEQQGEGETAGGDGQQADEGGGEKNGEYFDY